MKQICLFTGGRSEYGIQRPLLKALEADRRIHTTLIVACEHLDYTRYGLAHVAERMRMILNERKCDVVFLFPGGTRVVVTRRGNGCEKADMP